MINKGTTVRLTRQSGRKSRARAVTSGVALSDPFKKRGAWFCPVGFFSHKHGAWAQVYRLDELKEIENDAPAQDLEVAPSYRPEYRIWINMKGRCSNPRHQEFHNYAGRVHVCERWEKSFEAFYADMGPRPSARHSLDRIDNEGDYEPGNVRWSTPKEQARNTSRTRMLTVGKVTKPLVQWAEELSISPSALEYRLKKWPLEVAVSRTKAKDTPYLKGHQTKRKKGSGHYRAKLNEQKVQEILLAHHNGESTRSLAKRFGVSDSNIVFVVKRKTWKHVPFPQPKKEIPS